MSSIEARAQAAIQERTDWLHDAAHSGVGDWIDNEVFPSFPGLHRLGFIRKADWIRDTKSFPSGKPAYPKVYIGVFERQGPRTRAPQRDIARLFSELADAWEMETFMTSSLEKQVLNEAYQRVIGLGPDAVRFVIRRLMERGGNWFWALRAMTGEDPISPSDHGNYEAMRTAWLRWATERGLVDEP